MLGLFPQLVPDLAFLDIECRQTEYCVPHFAVVLPFQQCVPYERPVPLDFVKRMHIRQTQPYTVKNRPIGIRSKNGIRFRQSLSQSASIIHRIQIPNQNSSPSYRFFADVVHFSNIQDIPERLIAGTPGHGTCSVQRLFICLY